jgi:hypothetical protein
MSDTFLLLTPQEAAAVRGETSPGAWLAPVLLYDGKTHVLPVRVLDDPAHMAVWPLLADLPRRVVMPDEWPVEDPGG